MGSSSRLQCHAQCAIQRGKKHADLQFIAILKIRLLSSQGRPPISAARGKSGSALAVPRHAGQVARIMPLLRQRTDQLSQSPWSWMWDPRHHVLNNADTLKTA
jgi:hypothetical protein